ncbi:MAG: hypothetical protein M1828_004292 [Chrysothrix sp. TS-e1954]|nr:MAG: hypothetical protein M1828_004292 [Chrysothrix sp. TS-e1954]
MAEFVNLISKSSKPHAYNESTDGDLAGFVKDAFTLRTLVCAGAALQVVLFAIVPPRVAAAPAVAGLLYTIILTALQTANVVPYRAAEIRIPGKTSAQLPSRATGGFGSTPAAEPLVVFHLALRISHPLGLLAPGAPTIMQHFQAINNSCLKEAEKWGLMGFSHWREGGQGSNNTLMLVYYFRDIEGLNAFAHDETHRKGWDWLVKSKYPHIGFMHEAFSVDKGAYESIYQNFPPTLMGNITMKVNDEGSGGAEKWVRPIVSADKGALRSQFGRMRKSAGREHEAYGY